jgi:hypothetical protein
MSNGVGILDAVMFDVLTWMEVASLAGALYIIERYHT